MAPELAKDTKLTRETLKFLDIYAFGVVLYQLISSKTDPKYRENSSKTNDYSKQDF